jgi:SAM-dependent methyltransferase
MKKEIINALKVSKNIIDLGCGNNPIGKASVAVDCYINPEHRSNGMGNNINIERIERSGKRFFQAKIDEPLPFKDKEFDFAYSHHAFEHLDHPDVACEEMMRIAKRGAIITPSWFAEIIFGRDYHKWMVMERNNEILFFKKRDFENKPFGEHPLKQNNTWIHNDKTNPFDILLNDGGWYRGDEKFDRLAEKIRQHYGSSSQLMEVNFLWSDRFNYKIYE